MICSNLCRAVNGQVVIKAGKHLWVLPALSLDLSDTYL